MCAPIGNGSTLRVGQSELGFGKKNLKRVARLRWREETGGREARQETPVVACTEGEAGLG